MIPKVAALFLLLVLLAVSGCTSLQIEPTDDAGTKVGKVFGRTLLGASTLGLSEIPYMKRRQAKRAGESWLGLHINQAIAQLGPPANVNRGYGGGLQFYTWTWSTLQSNGYTSYAVESRITLTINLSGKIIAYSMQ